MLTNARKSAPARAIRVGFLLLPDFPLMALSAASEPLRAANLLAGRSLYECRLIGIEGDTAVQSSGGFALLPHLGLSDSSSSQFDAIITVSSFGISDKRVFGWLRGLARQGCAMGAVSVGSLVLARAGLLDGFRFTIHWELADRLVEEFPRLKPSRDLYVIDRGRFTCGGGVAGLDMMLAIISRQHGRRLATDIAENFLHTRMRAASDSQRMNVVGRYGITDPRLVTALTMMENHIEHPLSLEAIAIRAGISGRQLERLFQSAFQMTPARFYLGLRLKNANYLLQETDAPLCDIALRCGFASSSHLGHSYRQRFGTTPGAARSARAKRWQASASL